MIQVTKVLIVDDAAFMRMTIKMMLERNGFEIVGEAENGQMEIEKIYGMSARHCHNGHYHARNEWGGIAQSHIKA